MNLCDVELNKECFVLSVEIPDERIKTRIMELGLIKNTKVKVIKKSILKKTLLISFNFACFTLKDKLAKNIVVKYA